MIISHFPYGPTAYFSLHNVVLRHDIEDRGTVSEQFPHLIFNNFNTKLGARVMNILKYLFPVPRADSKRTMTFANTSDFVSFRCAWDLFPFVFYCIANVFCCVFRHHVFAKTNKNEVELMEVGPRFEMRRANETGGCDSNHSRAFSLQDHPGNARGGRGRRRVGLAAVYEHGPQARGLVEARLFFVCLFFPNCV